MNSMDEMSVGRRLTLSLCDKVITAEAGGEYTLPDYQPEIRRLLYVKPTVLPPAKYVGGGSAELNGTVDYQVLYVGADGGLYTVPLSAEYEMTVPLEHGAEVDPGEGVTVCVSTVCEAVNTRVSAPRKLTIRNRLRSRVRAFGKGTVEEQQIGEVEPGSIRRLLENGKMLGIAGALSDGIELHTEISGISEDTRVIAADATPFLSEITPREGRLCAVGEILLNLLVCRDGGTPEKLCRKLPFEGEVEMVGLPTEWVGRMTGVVSDLSVTVAEGQILCDICVLLEGRGLWNLPMTYTADLYSTETESVCEYADYDLPVALKCENRNLSQSERLPLEGLNLPEEATVLDAFGTAQLDACEQVGNRYVLTGQSRYLLLCEKDGEYFVTELNLPLRYETDAADGTPTGFDATAEVISCRVALSGDTLNLDAELSVVADFLGTESIRTPERVTFGEKVDCRGNRMIVYYPVEGDTPWTVAKKYHVSPEQLTEQGGYYLL